MKEHHEGKSNLSPERNIARAENKEEEKTVEGDTITNPREEMEDLQDIVLHTRKDKEDLKS